MIPAGSMIGDRLLACSVVVVLSLAYYLTEGPLHWLHALVVLAASVCLLVDGLALILGRRP